MMVTTDCEEGVKVPDNEAHRPRVIAIVDFEVEGWATTDCEIHKPWVIATTDCEVAA